MYIWQFAINDDVWYGRNWSSFLLLVEQLKQSQLNVIIYVHKLSYEFMFIKGVLHFLSTAVMVIDGRKVLKAKYENLEFRCSYLQTNYSLRSLLKLYKVDHQKLDLDYEEERFPDTPMSESDLAYCINDVLGLTEALRARMKQYGDSILTIPLTSTGYTRRECREAVKDVAGTLVRLHGDFHFYKLLRAAFRGGNTHANRFYTGYVVGNVKSVDRASSYPDVLVNCKFPMTPFKSMIDPSIHDIMRNIKNGFAVLMDITVSQIKLISKYTGCPYISLDKVQAAYKSVKWLHQYADEIDLTLDNGRILEATGTPTRMVITDIDLQIILSQYDLGEITVNEAYISRYAYLPDQLRDLIIQKFKDKTKLKGSSDPLEIDQYNKAKALINALYGLFAQDPAKIEWVYTEDDPLGEQFHRDSKMFNRSLEDCSYASRIIEEGQREAYEQYIKRSSFPYQIGIWVCAWARLRLQQGIDIVGDEKFIYTDTDSIKYIDEDIDFTEFNQQCIEDDKRTGAYEYDRHGKIHYLGVFESETDDPIQFKTWGAKKYLYKDSDGYHLTLAGVGKANEKLSTGKIKYSSGLCDLYRKSLETGKSVFECFEPGMKFVIGAGLDVKYNDMINKEVEYKGRKIQITDNAYLYESSYILGLSEIYEQLLGDESTEEVRQEYLNSILKSADYISMQLAYIDAISETNGGDDKYDSKAQGSRISL